MIKETTFDPIFDAQQSFRVLLNAFGHPGTIYEFEKYKLNQPVDLYPSNAIIALALFDNNVSFHASSNYAELAESYIQLNTSAQIQNISEADYVFLNGNENIVHLINECKKGDLSYPEKNATIILKVKQISTAIISNYDFELVLSGPGIESNKILYINGLLIENMQAIQLANMEFPLGLDIILTDAHENICSIPRSIALQIIQNN